MGNNLRGVGLLSNNGDCPYEIKIGPHVIALSKKEDEKRKDGGLNQKWKMSYSDDESGYVLELEKQLIGRRGNIKLIFNFHDDKCPLCFQLIIRKPDQINMIKAEMSNFCPKGCMTNGSNSIDRDVLTETKLHFYGYGNINSKGSLIVVQSKKKIKEKKPYAITLVHYFAKGGGNNFLDTNIREIGLSMVAKIEVSQNGQLNHTVENPVRHPASALFYMFEQVMKTGIWKPTSCPHCANNLNEGRSLLLPSDSEESDDFRPTVTQNGRGQYARRGLANLGNFFWGNGNGNFFERNKIYYFRRRLIDIEASLDELEVRETDHIHQFDQPHNGWLLQTTWC